jgi:hypothetical protein
MYARNLHLFPESIKKGIAIATKNIQLLCLAHPTLQKYVCIIGVIPL